MSSVQNLSNLGSMAIHTLREGSTTERIVIGSVLVGTGLFVAYKLYTLAARFFSKAQPQATLPRYELTKEAAEAIERGVNERHPIAIVELPEIKEPENKGPIPPDRVERRSLLVSLDIDGERLTQEKEILLAEALHAYHKFKTEIGGEDERFIFITDSYIQSGDNGLPPTLIWGKKRLKASIPSHYNEIFAQLAAKLSLVGLSLKDIKRSERPLAEATFKNNTVEKIHDLGGLYQIVKLQGPHILSNFEVEQKEKQIAKAKSQLHESRLTIIDKTLSTLRAVLIKKLVSSFSETHKEIFTIFGSNEETLHFVLENVCWHALDRVLESVENTFIPSKDRQKDIRKIDLDAQLANILKDGEKLKQAQACLVQILSNPNDDEAMGALVKVLLGVEGNSPERDDLVRKLQTPELQLEEEIIEQELGRLEALQKFYDTVEIGAAVADAGKNVLLREDGAPEKPGKIAFERLPPESSDENPPAQNKKTYAQEVDELSAMVMDASEGAVRSIANQKWDDASQTLDQELIAIPKLSAIRDQIIEQGWIGFKNRQALLPISGSQRWLITKKMIIQRLATDSLQLKGKEILHSVGKGATTFVNTLYGRWVIALLAFDKRTTEAQADDTKPADRIATTLIDSVYECHEALTRAKQKDQSSTVGQRELLVVKELNGEVHPSASNKPSADTVFLGKLILELLSILQPGGLTEDIRTALTTALTNPGELESTLIQKAFETYKQTIRPAAAPWLRPVGNLLVKALENIIEKKSASNVASQLSVLLESASINASLVDLLKDDASEITIHELDFSEDKDVLKWYHEDEANVCKLIQDRFVQDVEIKALEKQLEKLKNAAQVKQDSIESLLKRHSGCDVEKRALEKRVEEIKKVDEEAIRKISEELIRKKKQIATLDLQLAPELLRRVVIAKVDESLVGYALQFVEDLFELIQYPRIVRHIVFNILEKSVDSLATSLREVGSEENQKDLLKQECKSIEDPSVFDYLFSGQLKTYFGNKIGVLFRKMSPKDNGWNLLGRGAKILSWAVSGRKVFSGLQSTIEGLILKKYLNDPNAINWSAAKLVRTMNGKIRAFAQNQTDEGLTALVAARLKFAIGVKDKN